MVIKFFLILIASIIPVYFAALFVASTYHRLAQLRRRCVELARAMGAARDPVEVARLKIEHTDAVARYHQVRSVFPGAPIGWLFRFPSDAPASTGTGARH